ncbi:energy transducer TonB [Brevundimonas sp.]|uniref:energy transducer TonB n=1 Tax=Brevundimonas sp. TaxID=1871086 RepID=UPI001A23C819|nr:energy transducer TonB [Brevundimonas sp.]MBJ7486111.1 energy transducer TonB [Brevundimonas sp.]
MTDTPVEYHRSRYDAPRKKASPVTWLIALAIVSVLFVGLLIWVQKTKFELKQMAFEDDAVDVDIVAPPPPPITLPIEPTKKEDRVEYTGPPVIVPGPPPPPAPPAPPRPSVITNVAWSRPPRPTADDFPARAMDRGVSGSATVSCTAQANGRPANCRVVSETPAGMGFGQAAVRIVQRGQLSPRTVDGAATNATFTVRVPFNLGD